jgi:hypothetical protein
MPARELSLNRVLVTGVRQKRNSRAPDDSARPAKMRPSPCRPNHEQVLNFSHTGLIVSILCGSVDPPQDHRQQDRHHECREQSVQAHAETGERSHFIADLERARRPYAMRCHAKREASDLRLFNT